MSKSLFYAGDIVWWNYNNTFYIHHVLLLYTWKLFFYSFYKYIVCLDMSTIKYVSGYEKLKKRKEKLIESQKWSMDKFVISNKQNTTQNLD